MAHSESKSSGRSTVANIGLGCVSIIVAILAIIGLLVVIGLFSSSRPTSYTTSAPSYTSTTQSSGQVQTGQATTYAETTIRTNPDPNGGHAARLRRLNDVFNREGVTGWLRAAGVSGNYTVDGGVIREADNGFVSGIRVVGNGTLVQWPATVSTDRRIESAGNKQCVNDLCTNVRFTGPGTIWVDAQNWGQFYAAGLPVVP